MRQLILAVALLPNFAFSGSWESSRKTIIGSASKTYYCDCPIVDGKPDLIACEYEVRGTGLQANQLHVEHKIPASWFGRLRNCWTGKDKRYNCYKYDAEFKRCHNDVRNLAPAVGEINVLRGDKLFDAVIGEDREFGACDFEISFERKVVEPKQGLLGDLGRTFIYMDETCGPLDVPDDYRDRYRAWSLLP